MQICSRSFLIPENTDEIALLQGSKNLKQIRVKYRDREYSVFSEDDSDEMLMHSFLRKLDKKFYYEAIVLDEELDPERLANYIKIKVRPEIVIYINKESVSSYNIDPIRAKIEGNNIIFRWIPKLAVKSEFKYGLVELQQLLKSYRRICFIGTRARPSANLRLKKMCGH